MRLTLCLSLAMTFSMNHVLAQSYSDNFEAATLNPFWTVSNQFGTVSLSKTVAFSGIQSAKFSSLPGGQRNIGLSHKFQSAMKGTFSVWFYDAAPGQQTLYEGLFLYNSSNPNESVGIQTEDYDAFCYAAYLQTISGTLLGPNANCGKAVLPDIKTAIVSRTAGWHHFVIAVGSSTTNLAIDGVTVLSAPGDYTFDTVSLLVSGPSFRPDTVAYFDDFQFVPSSTVMPPSCQLSSIVPGPPTQLMVTMQDTGTGLQNISVVESINASVSVPVFSPGTTSTVLATATKLNQSQGSNVGFVVTNMAGLSTSCDPVDFRLELEGATEQHVFRSLPASEHYIRIVNGAPGVQQITFLVNGHKFLVPELQDGENYFLDIGSAMVPVVAESAAGQRMAARGPAKENNNVIMHATGTRGSSVYVLIGDASVIGS